MEDSEPILIGRGATTYFITLRLVDALPREVVEAWHDQLDRHLERLRRLRNRAVTEAEERDAVYRSLGSIDRHLNNGRGISLLREKQVAEAVKSVLQAGDGGRYRLHSWAILPNHVHVLATICNPDDLAEVVHFWKAEATRKVNHAIHRSGALWHAETIHTSLISPEEVERLNAQILNHAGLTESEEGVYYGSTTSRPQPFQRASA